jgi:hypothetical protein
MKVKVLNVFAMVVLSAVFTGASAQALPATDIGANLTATIPGVNSLKGDTAKLVIELDEDAKRYAKESLRMTGRSKAADDKYAKASVKLKKLAEVALKLKIEARSIKSSSALSKVRQKKGNMHKIASTVYLDLLEKTPAE